MRVEIPEFKKCCCCVPLRYGLIVWGYIKLFLACLVLAGISLSLANLMLDYYSRIWTTLFVLHMFAIILFLLDVAFSLMFIVGCHKKDIKLMKIYCLYAIYFFVLILCLSVYNMCKFVVYEFDIQNYQYGITYDLVNISLMFGHIALQVYLVILVRSEIIKLQQAYQFRFVNNVPDAECTLEINQQEVTITVEEPKI